MSLIFFFFSLMKTGFGFILCNLGSLLFLLMFHCKLHTIPENSLEVRLKKYLKFSLWCFLLGLSVLLQQIFYFYKVEEVEDGILIHHILYLGLSIPRHFSFPGDSGNRGMLFFHSSGNGELKVIPRGIGSGNRGIGELKFSN